MVNEEAKEWATVVKTLDPVNDAIITIYTSIAENINVFSENYHDITKDYIKEVSNDYFENANQTRNSFIFFKHVINNLQLYGVVNSDGGLRQQHGNTQAHEKEHATDEGNQSHTVFATGTTTSANIKDNTLTRTNISAGTNTDLNAMELEISEGAPPPSFVPQEQYDNCQDDLLKCKDIHLECKKSKGTLQNQYNDCIQKNQELNVSFQNAANTIEKDAKTLQLNQKQIDVLTQDKNNNESILLDLKLKHDKLVNEFNVIDYENDQLKENVKTLKNEIIKN